MQLTELKPSLKVKEVPVPTMGEGAVICMYERNVSSAVRQQKLFGILTDLHGDNEPPTEQLIAIMLICSMRKPDGSYLIAGDTIEDINLVAYQTSDAVIEALYSAYLELHPAETLESKKKKS